MDNIHQYDKSVFLLKIICAVLCLSLIVNIALIIKLKNSHRVIKVTEALLEDQEVRIQNQLNNIELNKNKETSKIFIHVTGAVNNPGVYQFETTPRVFTALEKAGGVTDSANITNINLATQLYDGCKVYIPHKGEDNLTDVSQLSGYISASPSRQGEEIININTASIEQLEQLSGIGNAKATDIINYRQSNGLFKKIEDIMNVKGIGASTYDRIKDKIRVK